MPGFPTDLENLSPAATGDIRSRLDNLGLRASSLLVDMSLVADAETHAANLETIRRAAEFAHGLGQRATPVIQTVMGGRSADWDASKALMAGRLREWGTAAASAGITVAVKGHALMAADRPGRVLWLLRMAQSPAIVVAYDYSHYEFLGISLEDSLRALAPYTRFVHLKDCIRDGGPPRFLLPGEGRTDYPRYLRLLRQLGYSGPVVAQASSMVFSRPGYDPIAAAGKCYATLAPAVIAANR